MKITRLILLSILLPFSFSLRSFADWPPISPDDLKMTDIKEQPGAPAVVLDREEVDDDLLNVQTVYTRIKILTDAGKEYANVELPYLRRRFTIDDVTGRTVHADGTIIPFTVKPFDKTVEKGGEVRVNVKSFTLPDVQIGSIIDFRYSLRYDDRMLLPPEWEVQTDLFQRKAYFKYIPFQNHGGMYIALEHGQVADRIAWAPFLGNNAQPQLHQNPLASQTTAVGQVSMWVDLNINDVPALIEEPYMPPRSITRWRVYFFYHEGMNDDDFWKAHSKFWSKDVESFLDKDKGVSAVVSGLISPTDTPEQKVRKIYAYVGKLENQDYIPERTRQEEKVLELKNNKGVDDVLEHRSGTHNDLNRLFVAMVRSAGIPASLIWVPDRSQQVFLKSYLSTRQFEAEVAFVQLDGKEIYLDPGTKFCPYGALDWRYTGLQGLRLNTKGAEFGQTPLANYTQSIITRMADVTLDEQGRVTGIMNVVFKGTEAMSRRQKAAMTDDQGRKKFMEDELREALPGNSEITMFNSPDWDNSETPLVAQFRVMCPLAVAAGKRLMLAQHLFQVSDRPRFTASSRTSSIYFHYPWQEADEVHIALPAGMDVESLAPDDTVKLDYAYYKVQQKQETGGKLFSRRDFVMGMEVFMPDKYKEVKGFFDKVKSDDDQPALIRMTTNVATSK